MLDLYWDCAVCLGCFQTFGRQCMLMFLKKDKRKKYCIICLPVADNTVRAQEVLIKALKLLFSIHLLKTPAKLVIHNWMLVHCWLMLGSTSELILPTKTSMVNQHHYNAMVIQTPNQEIHAGHFQRRHYCLYFRYYFQKWTSVSLRHNITHVQINCLEKTSGEEEDERRRKKNKECHHRWRK